MFGGRSRKKNRKIHGHYLSEALAVCLNCEVVVSCINQQKCKTLTQFQVKDNRQKKKSSTLQSQAGKKKNVFLNVTIVKKLFFEAAASVK